MAEEHTAAPGDRSSTALNVAGLVAGPLFLSSSIIQGLTRAGFDLTRQPVSFLSLGQLGWIERLTFITAGALLVAFAVGVAQARSQRGYRLESLFLSLTGAGVVIAGLFPPDPGFGYPPGTPDGPPRMITYHSQLHGVGFTLSFVGFLLVCVVNVRAAARGRALLAAAYSSASAVFALVLALAPGGSSIAVRDLGAAAILWAWMTQRAYRAIGSWRSYALRGRPAVPKPVQPCDPWSRRM